MIERGAEFVLAGYDVMRELAARFGLELADTGMSYYVREPRGVAVDTAALQAAGLAAARAATADRSVAEVVASLDLPAAVADAVLARVEISAALEADRLSAEVLEHAAAFEPLPSHRVAGGNQRLAEAMAAQLGDRVRLRTPVRSLDEIEADHVVLALPLPALRELALPDWKHAALDRVVMGHAAKLHIPLGRPAPTSAVMSVPDRYWCWTAAGDASGVLNCFAGSPGALERLAVDVRAGAVARARARAPPRPRARRRRRADHLAGRRVQHGGPRRGRARRPRRPPALRRRAHGGAVGGADGGRAAQRAARRTRDRLTLSGLSASVEVGLTSRAEAVSHDSLSPHSPRGATVAVAG